MRWWSMSHRGLGVADYRLLFAIPNGGGRSKIEACILKGEGVRAGVPDLFLAVPRGGYSGFFLELKAPGKYPRPEQREFLAAASAQGYLTAVGRDLTATTEQISRYLRGEELASGKALP